VRGKTERLALANFWASMVTVREISTGC